MFRAGPVGPLLLLLGCTSTGEPGRARESPSPTLVAQRVTATVQRAALQLVRLETEHDAFLTTPEHPFATPGSGWISAGQLVPDDWVVSMRFGAVRLSSVRNAPATRPVPVFNLSVAASHAYFVGTEQLLVHNTRCRPRTSESREEALQRGLRRREELNREIASLPKTTATLSRLAELRAQRRKVQKRIGILRAAQRNRLNKAERALRKGEAESEAARKAREDAQERLSALESRPPTSAAERAAFPARKAELEKQIATLTFSENRASRILTLLRGLAELESSTPAKDADRQALAERKKGLRTSLNREKLRARAVLRARRERAVPERRKKMAQYQRALRQRQHRPAAYRADTERPRDPLELLEGELASRLQDSPSEDRDARIQFLTDQIETIKELVEVRTELRRLTAVQGRARRKRERLRAKQADLNEIDEKLGQVALELQAIRTQRARLQVKERLLARLDKTPWAHPPNAVDEARLLEFEHQLGEGLTNEQQLADIERALEWMAPPPADSRDGVLDAAHEVDGTLSERENLMRQSASPERAAELQSSYERLQQALREERAAFEVALSALVNEHASIQTAQSGSSSGPTRLTAIQGELSALRAHWRASLQARLDSAQGQLHALRGIERLYDEAVEAELAREIALLERELQVSD